MKAAKHPQEFERLRALYYCEILDTGRDPEFDDIVELAATICGTPASTITFIDKDRQWFKASIGMPTDTAPLELALCAHTILNQDFMEIPDTRFDPRTLDNPLCASEGGCRFYAGAVLKSSKGLPLGTLCVLDFVPRELSEMQRKALRVLAHHVTKLLELRNENRRAEVLRQEIDHRVKNSLSTLAARIRLERRKTTAVEVNDAFDIVERHLNIAAALHEAMYSSGAEGTVDLKTLLEEIGGLIEETLPEHIKLSMEIESLPIYNAAASNVITILNEIITNATKHAFAAGRHGTIAVQGRRVGDNSYALVAGDDGVGVDPAHAQKPVKGSGIGMRIMIASAVQINGTLERDATPRGVTWRLEFPVHLP